MNRLLSTFRPLRAAACSALLAISAGCSEFDAAEQGFSLRYQDTSDRIELAVDTRGIFAASTRRGQSEAEVLARAKARVDELAAGARAFKLLAYPLIFDLDGEWDGEVKWMTKEQQERIFSLLRANVGVISAGSLVDEVGELGLTQRFEIKNATACMAAINELVTLSVQDELARDEKNPPDLTKFLGSEASEGNLRSFMLRGEPWVSLDAEALVIRVPMTPYDLALCMRELVREAHELDGAATLYQTLFANLEELKVEDGVVSFRFPVDASGRVQWSLKEPRNPDAKKFAAAFEVEERK